MSILISAFGENSIAIRPKVSNRIEAISLAGELLVASGRVGEAYVSSMIAAVETFGPYIVIAPGIALAHGKPSEQVFATGLSLVVLKEAIAFEHEANDPVSLVFGLASSDHHSHIELMGELSKKLSDSSLINSLLTCSDIRAIRQLFS